jgi:hypothetical protein
VNAPFDTLVDSTLYLLEQPPDMPGTILFGSIRPPSNAASYQCRLYRIHAARFGTSAGFVEELYEGRTVHDVWLADSILRFTHEDRQAALTVDPEALGEWRSFWVRDYPALDETRALLFSHLGDVFANWTPLAIDAEPQA